MQALGGWLKPRSGRSVEAEWAYVESELARPLSIMHTYHQSSDFTTFPLPHEASHLADGRRLHINVKPPSWQGWPEGQHDAWVDEWIGAIERATSGSTAPALRLTVMHEPENNVPRAGTVADWIAMQTRVSGIVRALGKGRPRFIPILTEWTYAGHNGGTNAWLPDPSIYDAFGVDGYCRIGVDTPFGPYPGPESIFAPFLSFLAATGKPGHVTETGAVENPNDPTAKSGWLTSFAPFLAAHPNVLSVLAFSSDGGGHPWWWDSSPDATAAWRGLLADPNLQGR